MQNKNTSKKYFTKIIYKVLFENRLKVQRKIVFLRYNGNYFLKCC